MLRSGFRLVKVFGININIDWSWLFIFALVTWNLAVVFGNFHSNWGTVLRWGLAASAAILFFVSVLLHELAHSLVAKAQGVPVRSITLFLFGGVSNIQREPKSAGGEFVMALLGPLTSIVIGIILTIVGSSGLGQMSGVVRDPAVALRSLDPVMTLVLWLGSVNLLVGVFNLIPGFPLDGGRILRSILWAATDNVRRATRWATGVGQAIAWAMIIGGIAMAFGVTIPFFGSGLLNGLWLAFIGWFLNSAASQSYQQVVINDVLEGVPVSRMTSENPPTVAPDITVSSLVHDYVMQHDDHAFPVVDDGNLLGMVTLADVRKIGRDQWDSETVRGIMTPTSELVTTTPDEDAADAMNKLMQRDVRQLPVLQQGRFVGLLRRQDLVKWLQLHAESVQQG